MNEVVCDFTKESIRNLLGKAIECSSVPMSKEVVFFVEVPASVDAIYHSIVGVTNHLFYKTQETTAQLFEKLQQFFSIPYATIQAWDRTAEKIKNLAPYAINELLYFPISAEIAKHFHWVAYHHITAQWKNASNQLVLHCENCADIVLPYTYRIAMHHCNLYKELIQKNEAIWLYGIEIYHRTRCSTHQLPSDSLLRPSQCFQEFLRSQAAHVVKKTKKNLTFELNPEDELVFCESFMETFLHLK